MCALVVRMNVAPNGHESSEETSEYMSDLNEMESTFAIDHKLNTVLYCRYSKYSCAMRKQSSTSAANGKMLYVASELQTR